MAAVAGEWMYGMNFLCCRHLDKEDHYDISSFELFPDANLYLLDSTILQLVGAAPDRI